ncbi:MAG: DUF2851 family protein [bacterium]
MELKVHDQEILLQKLWASKKLFGQAMQTTTGNQVEVIFGGTENQDAGPDFKDAVIKFDGRILKGDVEVHLDASGWYEHNHHEDAAYNGVILHLITEEAKAATVIEREDGVIVPQILINLEAYRQASWRKADPSGQSLIVDDCPLSKMGRIKIVATLNEAGHMRLRQKAERLREELAATSWNQLLHLHLFEALGYSKNQVPFRNLARLVPFEMVCQEMQWVSDEMALQKCSALLFGAAGLLPSQSERAKGALEAEALNYFGPLELLWRQMSHRLEIKPMKAHEWKFFRLRPQNFPTRRIAGMLQIIHRFYQHGYLEGFLKLVRGNSDNPKRLTRELEESIRVEARGYWRHHYHIEVSAHQAHQKPPVALIGKSRARDMVVNIVLPVLHLCGTEVQDGILLNVVRVLYDEFPRLSENSITRAMKTQLAKHTGDASLPAQSANQQQGLIFLHKTYCQRLDCGLCLALSEWGDQENASRRGMV